MNGSYVIIFVISFAISFTIDPTPTVPRILPTFIFLCLLQTTAIIKMGKMMTRKFRTQSTFVHKCNSGSLTFEGTNSGSGKLIHTITCTCGFEWQETWALTNWFWLKSSSPDDHWTSKRWNQNYRTV